MVRIVQEEVVHVRAYERKAELGGGFRCVASADGKALFESEVMADQLAAFRAGYDFVVKHAGEDSFVVGHYRGNRFKKNYFICRPVE